ncbi:hypothetical protein HHK36_012542 [Tetracentron sinense]|uniref:tRNA/rRNA methyltransferase SpoU type domain-containing protein n=1 Tax=Tetracentron sinense TaxID=13715 RepID=A0A835DI76_TETSI|nr:hypothetical protein HHK36_012542 [Tetracentron sinense]
MARSATAFGVSELILVGRRDFNAFGSHGSTSHLRFRHFHSLNDARLYLKERDCDICGVEITDGAVAVNQHPFRKSTAFLLGNEGTGLSAKECEICDFFVYIPQYGCGTASLNVTVAASIVLHHFGAERGVFVEFLNWCQNWCYIGRNEIDWKVAALSSLFDRIDQSENGDKVIVWAGFPERTRDGNKFVVAERPVKQVRRNYCTETAESVAEERKIRKENASHGFFDESGTSDSPSNLLDTLYGGL